MIEKKKAGETIEVSFYAIDGSFQVQRWGFESGIKQLAPWAQLKAVEVPHHDSSEMRCVYKLLPQPKMSEPQKRVWELLQKEGEVQYITELTYIWRIMGDTAHRSLEGYHNRVNKSGFDRRCLDSLVTQGVVSIETTEESLGNYPEGKDDGDGLRIVHTYRLAG